MVPTLTSVSIASNNGAPSNNSALARANDEITLTIVPSEGLIGVPTVAFTGAKNTATVTKTGGVNEYKAKYDVSGTDTNGVLEFTIDFTDASGNDGVQVVNTTNSSQVTVDTQAPSLTTVSIASNNGAPSNNSALAKAGDVITLSMTSNEPLLSNPTVSITNAGATDLTVANTSGNNYEATYTVASSDTNAAVAFTIDYNDLAGNAGAQVVNTTTDSTSVSVDTDAPGLSSVSIASNNGLDTSLAMAGNTITLSMTSDEALLVNPVVAFTGANNVATVLNVVGNSYEASYVVSGSDTNGALGFTIDITDLAGNTKHSHATTNGSSVRIDTVDVAVSSFTLSDTALKKGDTATVTLIFSEAVHGFSSAADITVIENGTLSNMTSGDGGITWVGTFTPTDDLDLDATNILTLANTYTDLAGNTGVSVSTANYEVDTSRPSMVITSANGASSGKYTRKQNIPLVFTASEPTNNFASSDIALSNCSVVSFTPVVGGATSATVFNVTIQATDYGLTSVSVPENVFTDLAGNLNTTASAFSWTYVNEDESNINIPLIFDMSGNATVFGEDLSADVVENHFKFTLDATGTQASADFINGFKDILYTVANTSGDLSGVKFYKKFANGENGGIAKAIQSFLFDTTTIKHAGTTPAERFGGGGVSANAYGVPIGSLQGSDASGVQSNYFSSEFIDNNGSAFYKILIRIASAHLMGHPFSQAFIEENTVQSDLKACDISSQFIDSFDLDTIGRVAGGVGQTVSLANGKSNTVLQTIYEQLLRVNLVEMGGASTTDSETQGITNSLVFKPTNTVTFFIRPRLFFVMDTSLGSQGMNSAVGDALGIDGTGFDNTQVSGDGDQTSNPNNANITLFNQIFSTNGDGSSPEGYKWLAGRTRHPDGTLNQWQSNYSKKDDVLKELNAKGASGMLDGHVWKIVVKL